jgi:hypothetical protein
MYSAVFPIERYSATAPLVVVYGVPEHVEPA